MEVSQRLYSRGLNSTDLTDVFNFNFSVKNNPSKK